MVSAAPCQCLRCERWVMCPTCPHHRRPENAEIGYLVGKPPAIDHISLAVDPHSVPAICVSRRSHCARRPFIDSYSPRLHEPSLHLVLHQDPDLLFVFFELGRDPTYRLTEGGLYPLIQV